ncbi:uncharacterized protein [Solanum lycopersicum]|uniref:uncharacterized protein n=1 Tax=Solanum lycopersicum TaxID=4081 RepID=UPI003748EDA8
MYGAEISYQQAWPAKERALELIRELLTQKMIVHGHGSFNNLRMHLVVASSEFILTVYEGGIRYIVCLERKTCSCGRFQHDEIPCPHAIAVLKKKNITDVHLCCSDYYKHNALTNTYAIPLEPMPDKREWKAPDSVFEEVVLPPKYKKMSGKPRKKKKKNADEKITIKTNCCGRWVKKNRNINYIKW